MSKCATGGDVNGTGTRDIVVVAASAGGVPALTELIAGLPAEFPGTVFVVLHVPAGATSALPRILERAGSLPASFAVEGELIRPGHIYVAPPDLHHLIVGRARMHLVFGPRENYTRPSADPLFRSASRAYGPRVVGVVLSGFGADGTEGLMAIKAGGGLAIAQEPAEAQFGRMPRYAIRYDHVDYTLPAAEIGPLLARLAQGSLGEPGADDPPGGPEEDCEEREPDEHHVASALAPMREGAAAGLICPECGGPLWEGSQGSSRWFACRVGHRWAGAEGLLEQHVRALEAKAWGFINALHEHALVLRQVPDEAGSSDPDLTADAVARGQAAEDLADAVREALPRLL